MIWDKLDYLIFWDKSYIINKVLAMKNAEG